MTGTTSASLPRALRLMAAEAESVVDVRTPTSFSESIRTHCPTIDSAPAPFTYDDCTRIGSFLGKWDAWKGTVDDAGYRFYVDHRAWMAHHFMGAPSPDVIREACRTMKLSDAIGCRPMRDVVAWWLVEALSLCAPNERAALIGVATV